MKRTMLLWSAGVLGCLLAGPALGDQVHYICMKSAGNSPQCPSNSTGNISWETLVGFGATVNDQQRGFGEMFCTFTVDGREKTVPYNVVQTYAQGGGEHGTGVWTVTCATAQ